MKGSILKFLPIFLALGIIVLGGCSSSSTIPPAPEPLEPQAPEPISTPVVGQQGSGGSGDGDGGGSGQGQGSDSSGSGGSQGSADSQSDGGDSDGAQSASGSTTAPAPSGASTSEERASAADDRLQEALGDFDQLMNAEQTEASREASETPTRSGGGSGENESGDSGGASGEESEAGADSGGAVGGSGVPEGDRSDRVPGDVGDGSGDDIVARQLREAAVNEEDPELRERLWDEYRAYKRSVEKGGK